VNFHWPSFLLGLASALSFGWGALALIEYRSVKAEKRRVQEEVERWLEDSSTRRRG
jgi:hypothetical protein